MIGFEHGNLCFSLVVVFNTLIPCCNYSTELSFEMGTIPITGRVRKYGERGNINSGLHYI